MSGQGDPQRPSPIVAKPKLHNIAMYIHGDMFTGCHFPRELTNIVRRKCLESQEILMKIFKKSFLIGTLSFFN